MSGATSEREREGKVEERKGVSDGRGSGGRCLHRPPLISVVIILPNQAAALGGLAIRGRGCHGGKQPCERQTSGQSVQTLPTANKP